MSYRKYYILLLETAIVKPAFIKTKASLTIIGHKGIGSFLSLSCVKMTSGFFVIFSSKQVLTLVSLSRILLYCLQAVIHQEYVHGKKGGEQGCSQTCSHTGALSSEYRLIKHVLREKLLLKSFLKSQVIKMLRIQVWEQAHSLPNYPGYCDMVSPFRCYFPTYLLQSKSELSQGFRRYYLGWC